MIYAVISYEFPNAMKGKAFLENEQYDVLFLDINMPGISGIEFIRNYSINHPVVFVTAYREFAIESYELSAFDYLLKPLTYTRFLKCFEKLNSHFQEVESNTEKNYFFIKDNQDLHKIFFNEIVFIEGLKDYVYIHTEHGKHIALISLKTVEQKLGANFIRTHKSYIVNKEKIERISGNLIHIGKEEIPISHRERERVLNSIVGSDLWKR
jgi:DNA-binding LytR/AlgR family response regulator